MYCRATHAGKEEELGFTITPRRSRKHLKVVLADLDFADDIALLLDEIAQAQELLLTVEKRVQESWLCTEC